MCRVMAHGGPDGEGVDDFGEQGFAFGHRRLALLDLTDAGHQPMADAERRYLLTYNGEIYNYQELKSELRNYPFKTGTDTEVILAGYATWGVDVFSKLKGMFALCLFDKKAQVSYIVRDPGGIKPLYYSNNNGTTVFASEIRAFKATNYNFRENPNWKVYFLAFGHIPEPYTTLENVSVLPKGCFAIVNHQTGTCTLQRFNSNGSEAHPILNEESAIHLVNKGLSEAVQGHLLADAKIGVFLSGGIDSSILTLVAHKNSGAKLHSLSINFQEEEFSEKTYQDMLTVGQDFQHSTYMVTYKDFEENFNKILKAIDQPSNDCINSWFVSKYAREQGLKAVLSGVGADEIFGGYPSFKKMRLIKYLQQLPKWVLRSSSLIPSMRVRRLHYLSYKNTIGQYLFLRGFFTPAVIARLLNMSESKVDKLLAAFPVDPNLSGLSDGEKASWIETNLYMQNQLLRDTDVMSMSHGLEIRVPYLDQDLDKFLRQIDPKLKFEQHRPKQLLIDSFRDMLPERIWNRPKMGFTFPFANWLKRNEQITNLNHYPNGYAKELINKFKKGRLHWSKAFALYQVFHVD